MRAPASGSLLGPLPGRTVLEETEVPSETTPGVWWTVRLLANGTYTCNCPDYRIRRSLAGEDCKHIVKVRASTGQVRRAS